MSDLYDNFLFVGDIIWNTKLPLIDFSISYWLIFWLVIGLSIYAVNGTSSNYNKLSTELNTSSSKIYKATILKNSKKGS